MSDLNEQTDILVEACMKGHRLSQERLYKLFYADMLRVCIRYVKTDELAREALNMSFLKIFQNIHSYDRAKGELGGWIRTIMIRTCIDLNRKECKFIELDSIHTDDSVLIVPDVLNKLYAADLIKLIRHLPYATQMVFNLSVIDGYSHQEIADKLGIGVGTSRWHLSEGKKQLRELINKRFTSYTEKGGKL